MKASDILLGGHTTPRYAENRKRRKASDILLGGDIDPNFIAAMPLNSVLTKITPKDDPA